ncbi:unnamed protein product [Rhizophagus irregularis]|nr:unnamed protein product [Rhizophagus irregularis]
MTKKKKCIKIKYSSLRTIAHLRAFFDLLCLIGLIVVSVVYLFYACTSIITSLTIGLPTDYNVHSSTSLIQSCKILTLASTAATLSGDFSLDFNLLLGRFVRPIEAEISGGITSLKGDKETVVLVFCGVSVAEVVILRVDSVDEVVILRVEEAIFRDADAEEAIFCGVGVDEVAIFGDVGVDEVAIFHDADVDDRDAGIEEVAIFGGVGVDEVAIFRDADVNDRDTGVEEAIFRDADVEEAIFCGVGVDEVAIFGGVGVEEAIFCGAGVDNSAIFGGGVFGFDGFLQVIIGRRKRIAANILDEYNNPSSSTSE